jgi:RimJ/RimL family protein N-acetyltransferase
MLPDTPAIAEPIVNIVGEKIALGPLRRDLMPLYDRWFNDFEVGLPYFLQLGPHTREAREAWYERLAKDDPSSTDFLIYERATLRPIGKTVLYQIDHFNRTAAFGIIIGEKDCWGNGYGTETATLMLDYGFTILGLHSIMLTVDAHNERAIRAYRRAGFREFGRRREARRRGSRVYDEIYMDCLATEFRSPQLHRLLPQDAVSSSGREPAGITSEDPAVQVHDDATGRP